jgi:hypothetical protein
MADRFFTVLHKDVGTCFSLFFRTRLYSHMIIEIRDGIRISVFFRTQWVEISAAVGAVDMVSLIWRNSILEAFPCIIYPLHCSKEPCVKHIQSKRHIVHE